MIVLLHPFGGSLASKKIEMDSYISEVVQFVHSVNFVGSKLLMVKEQLIILLIAIIKF